MSEHAPFRYLAPSLSNWGADCRALMAPVVDLPSRRLYTSQISYQDDENRKKTRKRTVRKDGVAPPVDYKAPFR